MTPLDPTVKSLIGDPYGAYAALLRRFPALALDAPAEQLRHRPALRARGLLELPVQVRPDGREPA